jgi:hypothetical protein
MATRRIISANDAYQLLRTIRGVSFVDNRYYWNVSSVLTELAFWDPRHHHHDTAVAWIERLYQVKRYIIHFQWEYPSSYHKCHRKSRTYPRIILYTERHCGAYAPFAGERTHYRPPSSFVVICIYREWSQPREQLTQTCRMQRVDI